MFTLSGSMLSGILILSAVVVAAAGVALAVSVLFIVVMLSRGARLIASRAGQGPVEMIHIHPRRPSRTMRYVVLRPSPQFAFSRSLFSHNLARAGFAPVHVVQRRGSAMHNDR